LNASNQLDRQGGRYEGDKRPKANPSKDLDGRRRFRPEITVELDGYVGIDMKSEARRQQPNCCCYDEPSEVYGQRPRQDVLRTLAQVPELYV